MTTPLGLARLSGGNLLNVAAGGNQSRNASGVGGKSLLPLSSLSLSTVLRVLVSCRVPLYYVQLYLITAIDVVSKYQGFHYDIKNNVLAFTLVNVKSSPPWTPRVCCGGLGLDCQVFLLSFLSPS